MSADQPSNSKRKRRVNGVAAADRRPARPAAAGASHDPGTVADSPATAVRPWHLILGITLLGVVASVVATRGGTTTNTVSIGVAIACAGLVAAAFFRTVLPFVSPETGEQTEMLGGQTRAALEREKLLVLRAIKAVEFDRAMRKVSEGDYQEMVNRLRVRAVGLIRQLDGAGGYRELIERDLAARLAASGAVRVARPSVSAGPPSSDPYVEETAEPAAGTCLVCGGTNDEDARFCKSCGSRLAGTGAA
jgi:hypothetical protein